ncbi:electron transport complex bd cytochrome b subunit [Pontimonas salivibrio]|uniref:Electron transport complex bd cytochrome b subunit n=1 Tax=Pontimonas salivibrio TaxID=1159327 RepID=A0A2L2BQ41_9MICO|nr:cytochrome d ubiquinol oxidase subunit II [Pontimonas salivibrio]AVG23767.1 electron transport complex bd cytochrome b subunit [Pontimonas salivibrio]
MDLAYVWFLIVGFLFVGYFVLDGFDFGVGMSLPFIGKDNTDRRVLINTIGPVWDLNETWLIVAGAALFAAFPIWYGTLFSGFYLALLVILLALIVRGVSFEYRHQGKGEQWTNWFDWMIVVGSALPALLWGVAFANIIQGVPIDETGNYAGTFFTLLNPYGLLGGLTTLMLFFTHGVIFVTLKTDGELKARAKALVTRSTGITVAVAASFLLWTAWQHRDIDHLPVLLGLSAAAAVFLIAAWVLNMVGREGWAFTTMALTIVFAVGAILAALYPNVMPSSIDPAYSLTIENASSTEYTLTVMTWIALFSLPLVMAYQGWTYWVFRKRVTRDSIPVGASH